MLDLSNTFRVLAIHIINPREDPRVALNEGEELESLIDTVGGEIIERLVQKLNHPNYATYIGPGKLEEAVVIVGEKKIDVVVLSATVKPGQLHAIKLALEPSNPNIQVWDRVDLILHIFDKHASTTEAKLQIQLARMKYMGPRIYGMGYVLSRQGGGIGTLGVGETNSELMRRHWRNEVKKISNQLKKIGENRELQLEKRKQSGLKTVSIVGYTNAGKSSLFNLLTKKSALVEDVLFATLDSSVSKYYIPELKEEILLTDTIGFIRNLPPHLIQAFKSTLIESIHADVLLHVIDVSDPEVDTKIQVVNEILISLGINLERLMYVFNKIDATEIDRKELLKKYERFNPIIISVKKGEGIEALNTEISKRVKIIEARAE